MSPMAAENPGIAVSVSGLEKTFGKFTAVNKISFDIKPGEIFGFLGPNGAGKSTTIRMLCGILTPTSGRGTVLGFDIIKEQEEIKENKERVIGILKTYLDHHEHNNLEHEKMSNLDIDSIERISLFIDIDDELHLDSYQKNSIEILEKEIQTAHYLVSDLLTDINYIIAVGKINRERGASET